MRSPNVQPVGIHLRAWRNRRQLSQLDLAGEAEISARHLSFLETGRATPSRDMVLRLADVLDVPVRERNVLLVSAGYAPSYPERDLADASLASARAVVDVMLERQKPYPAFALDRYHTIVASNGALPEMFEGVEKALLEPPVNAVRLSLHPQGMSRRIENLAQWRAHALRNLRREIEQTADARLIALENEVLGYPAPPAQSPVETQPVMIPFTVRIARGVLSFFTTTMIFGTALDVTLAELSVELFFPADDATEALVRRLA